MAKAYHAGRVCWRQEPGGNLAENRQGRQTKKDNWDEWRARLLEEQGRIRENGKPKLFISDELMDFDNDGDEFNFLVKELENLRWEENKPELDIEQKPLWGKQAKHAIDALSYIIATINKPVVHTPMPKPTTGLVKPFPGMAA